MILPEAVYRLTDANRLRYPTEFIIRRGVQPGSGIAAQTIPLFEGYPDRHLVVSSCSVRVNLTANGAAETRLERISLELNDIATGAARSIAWEVSAAAFAAGTGLHADNSTAPIAPAAGSANANYAFNVPIVGMLVPANCLMRFLVATQGGVPVLLGGTGHLVGIAVAMGEVNR